jgi:hypothetical protein
MLTFLARALNSRVGCVKIEDRNIELVELYRVMGKRTLIMNPIVAFIVILYRLHEGPG